MNKIEPFQNGRGGKDGLCGFTSIEEDIFILVGIYVGALDDIPIIFDSGCSVTMMPNDEDFYGLITPVNKTMMRLGATAKVKGEALIKWVFRDDYGVKQAVCVRA